MSDPADNEVFRATPLGILTCVLSESDALKAWNALELHIRRFYGPVGGIVVDGETVCFTKLERGND